jgi:U4/U6 small nuclear ribonucleoprotein PRP4
LMAHFEDKKRKRDLTLPTTDRGVKLKLRSLGEPICLFGEEARDRRERLRELLVRAEDLPEGALAAGMEGGGAEGDEGPEQQGGGGDDKHSLFYTEGAEELKVGRQQIAKYSLARGGERVRQAKRRRERIEKELAQAAKDGVAWEDEAETSDLKHVAALENRSSQVGDDRPISTCAFSGDGGVVATGSWSGLIKLWETPGCVQRECGTLRGHTERVTSVAFHPDPSLLAEPRAHHLASGSADRKVQLWSLGKEEPLHSLEGHFDTVSSVTYHPSGKFLVSTSFDKTWRLWDLQTQQSLLVQEGHSKGVYTAACQVDGSLLATSGLDCAARIWCVRCCPP